MRTALPITLTIIMSMSLMGGCSELTQRSSRLGGPCKYQRAEGIATVRDVRGQDVFFTFYPHGINFSGTISELPNHRFSQGQEFLAEADIIERGTCTPFILKSLKAPE